MKYVKQFGIILLISFAGEVLNYLLPLPVPASIYGLVLMFLCLQLRVFRLEDVRDTALFLIEIMPLMFIPAATGLMTSWGIIRAKLFAYLAIAAFYAVTVSGHIKSTIPLLLLLDRLYPLYGCALVQPVVDLISLIVALVLYRRLRRTSVV